MEINFLIFFIRYYLYRNLKVEGSLKWKWSLVSFTIKCYKKKLYAKAEQSNSQVYRKKSFQKCSCISTRCQFYRAWVKRAQWTELWNAKQNNMNFIIWLYQNFMNVWVIKSLKIYIYIYIYCFSSRCLLYCAGHNFLRKNVSLL